ncbi:hypothetical protein P175DRAFT_0558591 [Aspergillus ochraceoroseus IBT 24754]|uniref:Short chain oxidoreductase (CsgA) n=3 Tax=Aspergillus subgen. Nidulantes TaxID=2720870 RepID=A0A0F8V3I2_9EURO|nr:uncharacterized protein P175DRAFT_0558591 [Aspergillus ochraceoroseus IBT 24754]KKK15736.1 hypothetical protein AOCH_007477 [Aspergillus ochraceoroseus]KKK26299.1 hypothetical protein ARAM_001583 [Aspergillus rambellii]PTU20407.1 hypothetical protein P175DRAFT_0558591 [Aspergillus ochraceoroseus IBT 24754]
MSSYLVTGASRGIGLAAVTQLAALPETEVSIVFATTRQADSPGLVKLAESTFGRVVPVQMDANTPESLQAAVKFVEGQLNGQGLDVLVNNAGIMPSTQGPIENMEGLTETFHTNVTLTHLVTGAFMPLLRQGTRKIVANISSTMGSITMAKEFKGKPVYAYNISKTGMNMLTAQYANCYEDEGFTFFVISPGWLKTEMGGSQADLPVETGAKEVVRMLREADSEFNGRFRNIHVPGWENKSGPNKYDGKDAPW